jgi:hypothetical protein
MRPKGLTLDTTTDGHLTRCTLALAGVVEARGALADAKLTGPWTVFGPDGAEVFSADLTGDDVTTTAEASQLRTDLTIALMQRWLGQFDGPPAWMQRAGVGDVAWRDLVDDSRPQTVKRFPVLLHAACCPIPMVQAFAMRGLHLAMCDDEAIFPVTPIAVPILVALAGEPGAPVEWVAEVLVEVADAVTAQVDDQELDLDEEIAEATLLGRTAAALRAAHATLSAAPARGPELDLLVRQLSEYFSS